MHRSIGGKGEGEMCKGGGDQPHKENDTPRGTLTQTRQGEEEGGTGEEQR